jgi:hypothetical protein
MRCRDLTIELPTFTDNGVSKGQQEINGQIRARFNDVYDEITEIRHNMKVVNVTVLRVAYQKVAITAAMLSASDDPTGTPVDRSVLTTASQSEWEFDWMLLRHSLIKFGGRGEPGHVLILDRDDRNAEIARISAVGDHSIQSIPSNVCRPYGMSGLKLQFGWWENKAGVFGFWPTPIAAGSWVYLEQVLPAVDMP